MKLRTAIFFCLLVASGTLSAQIPNPYFETWDAKTRQFPMKWTVEGTCERISGPVAPFAVRMRNNSSNGEITEASQVSYDTNGVQTPAFGISGTADSLSVTYRSNLGADTAVIYVYLMKSGDSIPTVFQEILIYGNTSGWVTRSYSLDYIHPDAGVIADTGYMLIYSADPVNGPYASGYIDIAGLRFKSGSSALTSPPNQDFSQWGAYTFDFPVGWTNHLAQGWDAGSVMNHSARSTDARTGASAIRLQAYTIAREGKTDTIPGFAVTVGGTSMEDLLGPEDIETPVFPLGSINRPNAIHGFIKSELYGNDRFMLFLNIFDADSIVASAVVKLGGDRGTFTEFSEDITWTPGFGGAADSAVIFMAVADSSMDYISDLRSWAIVDDLWLENFNVGTTRLSKGELLVYPNPARDVVHVKTSSAFSSDLLLMGSDGRIVKKVSPERGSDRLSIQTSGLPAGMYLLQEEGTSKTIKILLQP